MKHEIVDLDAVSNQQVEVLVGTTGLHPEKSFRETSGCGGCAGSGRPGRWRAEPRNEGDLPSLVAKKHWKEEAGDARRVPFPDGVRVVTVAPGDSSMRPTGPESPLTTPLSSVKPKPFLQGKIFETSGDLRDAFWFYDATWPVGGRRADDRTYPVGGVTPFCAERRDFTLAEQLLLEAAWVTAEARFPAPPQDGDYVLFLPSADPPADPSNWPKYRAWVLGYALQERGSAWNRGGASPDERAAHYAAYLRLFATPDGLPTRDPGPARYSPAFRLGWFEQVTLAETRSGMLGSRSHPWQSMVNAFVEEVATGSASFLDSIWSEHPLREDIRRAALALPAEINRWEIALGGAWTGTFGSGAIGRWLWRQCAASVDYVNYNLMSGPWIVGGYYKPPRWSWRPSRGPCVAYEYVVDSTTGAIVASDRPSISDLAPPASPGTGPQYPLGPPGWADGDGEREAEGRLGCLGPCQFGTVEEFVVGRFCIETAWGLANTEAASEPSVIAYSNTMLFATVWNNYWLHHFRLGLALTLAACVPLRDATGGEWAIAAPCFGHLSEFAQATSRFESWRVPASPGMTLHPQAHFYGGHERQITAAAAAMVTVYGCAQPL